MTVTHVRSFVYHSDQLSRFKGRSGFHVWLVMWRSRVRTQSKALVVYLSKKLYPYCLVLVGSRNGFERVFAIELK